MAGLWAGIDWSEQLNDVAVVDRAGTVVARARVPETPERVKELLRLLAGLRSSHRHVPVAIETGRGLLVRALSDAGQTVVPINPSVVARYRGRLRPTRQKTDKSDAALLAHILRTDGPLHRPLTVHSDQAEAWPGRSAGPCTGASTSTTSCARCCGRSTRRR
ncbi:IS110 family transposase [Streptomyces murinus]|uniref:IS110 family transposase n=1 Tax=Streptomyces murinus TaxID=33900 RepID=UPI00382F0781